jgi:hypothetical protein
MKQDSYLMSVLTVCLKLQQNHKEGGMSIVFIKLSSFPVLQQDVQPDYDN